MKVFLFILFLTIFHNAFSDSLAQPKGISHGKSPKKNFQIVISRKFLKPVSTQAPQTKKVNSNNGYTVFPSLGNGEKKLYDVPDSPYFQLEPNEKHRVKKVLPDYSVASRQKRDVAKQEVKAVTVEGNDIKVLNKTAKKRDAAKKKRRSKKKSKNSKNSKSSKKSKGSKGPRKNGKRKSNNGTKSNKRHGKPLRYTRRQLKRLGGNRTLVKKHKRSGRAGTKNKTNLKTKVVKPSRRLIAAQDAIIEDYPYVVSIQKDGEHWCAGALLNPRLVITSANCIWKSSRASRLSIRAGSRNTNSGGQTARVQEVMKHPDWSIRRNPDNDLGFLLLDRNLKFSHSLHGVDLPNRVMWPAFEDAWITSWGAERRDGVFDKPDMTLQSIHARLLDRGKCNNVTQRYGVTVTENFICLSQLGKRAPCTRDTGAPAVSDGVLWGVASWGIRKLCGTQRFPAMFSYVASQSNMDFVANATRYLMADERFYPFLDRDPGGYVHN